MTNTVLTAAPQPPERFTFNVGHKLTVSDLRDMLAQVDAQPHNLETYFLVNSGNGNHTLVRPK